MLNAILLFYYNAILQGNTDPIIIKDYIAVEAIIAKVDVTMALHIAEAESKFNKEAVGDHGTSFGIWQIHNPQSKGLTKEQAKDIVFSTTWSMNQLKQGNCRIWSTCNTSG